ncbi:LolA family protein [Microlunatus soli]|uniref:Outer membrane lipoprotein-sorting protein n=1 Tax=Microlunatus soli TaxID=630515 RepID=A0A1H1WW32_9ACTN|nr:hypothetical protein [Microlunatus soli]SDT00389.1 hypothetical protein SAMN04489812_3795 [Microlunatus soli]
MSRTAVRWLAPIAAAALAIGGGLAATTASADPNLPKKSPQELLTAVAGAKVDGLSGTVTETAELGLPSMPSNGPTEESDFGSLASGTHTLKVWTSGEDKSRVSLLGTYGESSLIRNGNQAWLWSSKEKKAVHTTYAGKAMAQRHSSEMPATPQEAAKKALDAIDPSTSTKVARNVTVADRPAYELVLTPKDDRSLVGEVAIAVDAQTSVPLRVEVSADGAKDPAFSVGFTDVDFSVPAAKNFTFTPSEDTSVTEKKVEPKEHGTADKADAAPGKVVGDGWTSVLVTDKSFADQLGKAGSDRAGSDQAGPHGRSQGGSEAGQMLNSLPKVSGSWGSGRLLTGSLFSAVLTDDGRVAVGAVKPALLYSALEK